MKIRSASIKNFKTFSHDGIAFSFNNLTTLLGENSAGKSNILEALDLFFNFSKTKVSFKSFHHDNFLQPIIIELIFDKLNDNELKTFKSHLDENNNLVITQYIEAISTDEEKKLEEISVEEIDFVESKHGTKLHLLPNMNGPLLMTTNFPRKKI